MRLIDKGRFRLVLSELWSEIGGKRVKNPCKECDYYHPENNTCQSKKVATMGDGHVTFIDRLFCKPYKADRKKETSDVDATG